MSLDPDYVLFEINGRGNQRPELIASQTITFILAVIALLLRFFCRHSTKAKFWWDDWLLIPALALSALVYGIFWWWMSYGLGRYIGGVTSRKLRVSFLVIWIAEFVYDFQLTFVYFSIILLYLRIFSGRSTRIYCSILGTLRIIWLVSTTIVVCLECQPLNGFWNRLDATHCAVDLKKFFLSGALVEIILDVALLLLSLYKCWHLQLSRQTKLLLSAVFASGTFVTVISCVRLKALLDLDTTSIAALNITWTFVGCGLWTGVEINMAIVSACLPCLRPLAARAVSSSLVPSSLRKRKESKNTDSSPSKMEEAQAIRDQNLEQNPETNAIAHGRSPGSLSDTEEHPHRNTLEKEVDDSEDRPSFTQSIKSVKSTDNTSDAAAIDNEAQDQQSNRTGSAAQSESASTKSAARSWERPEDVRASKLDETSEVEEKHHHPSPVSVHEEKEVQPEEETVYDPMHSCEKEHWDGKHRESDVESEFLHLPLQDFDGRDIVPENSRLDRPPSWEVGVNLWPIDTDSAVPAVPEKDHKPFRPASVVSPISPESPNQGGTTPFKPLNTDKPLPLDKITRERISWRVSMGGPGWI